MADNNNISHLPFEILEIFLSKLSSVKSLLRFKSVSKSWNAVISDPVFVRNHHQRSKESNSENIFLRRNSNISSEGFSLVKLDDQKLHNIRVLGARDGLEDDICFCKGLLLLRRYVAQTWSIALWNPSTGEEKRLLPPGGYYPLNCGLCHDPTTDDFKVVLIMDGNYHYSVYSFKNNSWKEMMKYERDYGLPNGGTRGVCLDGASYWAWTDTYVERKIIYFDPRDDKLKILQKPENVDDNEPIYLVDLGGRLCLYCNGRDENVVRIWRKEKGIDDHSWKALMNVENIAWMPIWSFEPQCLVGDKIVIRVSDNRLVVYDPYEKRFERFDEDTQVFGHGLVPYVDSPFFPSTQRPMHI